MGRVYPKGRIMETSFNDLTTEELESLFRRIINDTNESRIAYLQGVVDGRTLERNKRRATLKRALRALH